MSHKSNFLIIYAVSNDKARRKLVKLLDKYGTHIQYSAFERMLHIKARHKWLREIDALICPKDSVRFYKLLSSAYVVGEDEYVVLGEPSVLIF